MTTGNECGHSFHGDRVVCPGCGTATVQRSAVAPSPTLLLREAHGSHADTASRSGAVYTVCTACLDNDNTAELVKVQAVRKGVEVATYHCRQCCAMIAARTTCARLGMNLPYIPHRVVQGVQDSLRRVATVPSDGMVVVVFTEAWCPFSQLAVASVECFDGIAAVQVDLLSEQGRALRDRLGISPHLPVPYTALYSDGKQVCLTGRDCKDGLLVGAGNTLIRDLDLLVEGVEAGVKLGMLEFEIP
eukprot:Sspe_Gene.45047::Locus_22190_Transcript_1_1_Confidence_1.000_Length_830::g.45047::m.45047